MNLTKFATKQAPKKLTAVPVSDHEIEKFKKLDGESLEFYIMWPMALADVLRINEMLVKDVVYELVVDPDTFELLFGDGVQINDIAYLGPMARAIFEELGK